MPNNRYLTRAGLLVISGLTLAACGHVTETPQTEPDTATIAQLFEQWNASLQTGDAGAVTANYAEDSVLLPTVSNKVRSTHAETEDYFDHFLALEPVGHIDEQHIRINGDTAINAGIYTFNIRKDGEPAQVQARYTFVYEHIDGDWLIVNHHSSAMPEIITASETVIDEDVVDL